MEGIPACAGMTAGRTVIPAEPGESRNPMQNEGDSRLRRNDSEAVIPAGPGESRNPLQNKRGGLSQKSMKVNFYTKHILALKRQDEYLTTIFSLISIKNRSNDF
ncbi:hypothetical protein, partial [Caldithrix abyssi]